MKAAWRGQLPWQKMKESSRETFLGEMAFGQGCYRAGEPCVHGSL